MCTLGDGIVLAFLMGCAVCDWREKSISIGMLILFSISILVLVIANGEEPLESVCFGIAIGLCFFLVSIITGEAVGFGDSWIILLLGIYLGGKKLLYLLMLASFFAGCLSLFYLWIKRWDKKETLAFVPFLASAYLGVMLL